MPNTKHSQQLPPQQLILTIQGEQSDTLGSLSLSAAEALRTTTNETPLWSKLQRIKPQSDISLYFSVPSHSPLQVSYKIPFFQWNASSSYLCCTGASAVMPSPSPFRLWLFQPNSTSPAMLLICSIILPVAYHTDFHLKVIKPYFRLFTYCAWITCN